LFGMVHIHTCGGVERVEGKSKAVEDHVFAFLGLQEWRRMAWV
jgi:hypothetical protein